MIEAVRQSGKSLVLVAVDRNLAGIIELDATLRPEAKAVIKALQADGKSIHLIFGDHVKPTQELAQTLGITSYYAETLPATKPGSLSSYSNRVRLCVSWAMASLMPSPCSVPMCPFP